MRTQFSLSLITVLLFGCLAPSVARGQDEPAFEGQQVIWPEFEDPAPGAPEARIGFAFDLVSRSREAAISVGEPLEVLLVAWDIQVALHAWEARLLFDERLTVVSTEYISDLHMEKDGDIRAMLKPERCNPSPEIVLARFEVLLLEEGATDLVLGIGPASIPSQVTDPTDAPVPCPVYQICRPGQGVRPFLFSEVSAVLNPAEVHPDPIEGEKPRFAPQSSGRRQ